MERLPHLVLGLASAALAGMALAASVAPPAAAKKPVTDTYHGIRVVDAYRWLEDGNDPAVRAWSQAENAHARAVLDALPGRAALRVRVNELIAAYGPAYTGLKWSRGTLFAFKWQPSKDQAFLVALRPPLDPGAERALVDPNVLDSQGGLSIDWFQPSPDGKLMAVSLSKGGSENGSGHVYEVATGKEVGEPVPGVNGGTAGGSLAWAPDSSGFYYSRYPRRGERPDADLGFYTQVWFHALGTPPEKDRYEAGKDFPKIAEIKLRTGREGGWVLANVQNGDGGQCSLYLRSPAGEWTRLTRFDDGIVEGVFGPGPALYLLSRAAAPNGKILRLPLRPGVTPRLADAAVIVAESPDSAVQWHFVGADSFVASASHLYVVEENGGPQRVRVFDLLGKALGELPLPGPAEVYEVVPLEGDNVLYSVESYLAPKAWYRYDAAGSAPPAEVGISSTSPLRFADAEVVRETATSKDGTKVPMSILRRKGTPHDGRNPTLLTGYGGFGKSLTPGLDNFNRLWLDIGGVVVYANLRGGGEYGERWHRAGQLVHKQNVFDDFVACAEHLIRTRYTTPARLAIQGYSNGGLLMGAALTQRPDLFRAVVSDSGVYDMLRVELQPNGQFNTTEYGTVKDPAQFKALYAYSPYHRVKDGTTYPPVLLMTGDNDPRVDPSQSRKLTARLRAAEGAKDLVLLRIQSDSGHGPGTALSETVEQLVDVYSFLFHELGISYSPAPRSPARPASQRRPPPAAGAGTPRGIPAGIRTYVRSTATTRSSLV